MVRKQVSRRRRMEENIENGVAHIRSTFNNTVVTITDESGSALLRSSAGALGFRGSKKSTPFAIQITSETTSKSAVEYGLKTAEVIVKGPGPGRESAIHALQSTDLEVTAIRDATPVSHNGCRSPKRRRV